MKQSSKKGLSAPMETILGVVVFIIIALAVIMVTGGSVTQTGIQTDNSGEVTGDQILCNTQAISYCNINPTADTCISGADKPCSKCMFDVACSSVKSAGSTSSTSNVDSLVYDIDSLSEIPLNN